MNIQFHKSAFIEKDFFTDIDKIFEICLEDRHNLVHVDADQISESEWFQSTGGRHREYFDEAIEKLIVKSAYQTSPKIPPKLVVIASTDESNECENFIFPDDAVKSISEPCKIVLENAESDGAFLTKLVNIFKRDRLSEAKENGWLRYDNAGGKGEIKKRIESLQKDYLPGPTRIFVMTDSDCVEPGQTDKQVLDIIDFCRSSKIEAQFLSRREIENYVTPSMLQLITNKNSQISAYSRLDSNQKQIYDVKNGLQTNLKGHPTLTNSEAIYFKNLDNDTIMQLSKGFGSKVWRAFERDFQDPEAEYQDFLIWCDYDVTEFEKLLDTIESLI